MHGSSSSWDEAALIQREEKVHKHKIYICTWNKKEKWEVILSNLLMMQHMRYTPSLCHKVEAGKHVAPHDMGGGVNSPEGQEAVLVSVFTAPASASPGTSSKLGMVRCEGTPFPSCGCLASHRRDVMKVRKMKRGLCRGSATECIGSHTRGNLNPGHLPQQSTDCPAAAAFNRGRSEGKGAV